MDIISSKKVINDEEFNFVMNGSEIIRIGHDVNEGYEDRHKLFQRCIIDKDFPTSNSLISNSFNHIKNVLSPEVCQSLIAEQKSENFNHKKALQSLLPEILNQEIDTQVKSYFKTEYAITWYEFTEVTAENDESFYYTKWHCDGGPSKHLKIMVYFNATSEHGGNTFFYPKEKTTALKDQGYIFCKIQDRKKDISSLLSYLGFDPLPEQYNLTPGDAILFNPFDVAHRCDVPKEGQKRYTLSLCLVPSPLPWDTVNHSYWQPAHQCMSFQDIQKSISLLPVPVNSKLENDTILVSGTGGIQTKNELKYLLKNIFSDDVYVNDMYKRIIEFDPNLNQVTDLNKLMQLLKNSFKASIPWEGVLKSFDTRNLLELAEFEESNIKSTICYNLQGKPNPNAVFWPNPTHPTVPKNKFEQLPYVIKHPIMTKDTPIGSAGSCFAFEISKVLQQDNYNYVISERIDDPNSEVIVDGYNPGDKIVKFSANYGIIFNSPSFTQLAEKAFSKRKQQKLLAHVPGGLYTDPYRENVFFKSVAAYEKDYDAHTQALKNTFLTCEVFVITLGLNECWMLKDGTALSRNPKSGMSHLIEHKILSVAENVAYIQKFFDIIKENNPKFKLVITLSPIPFLATGRANSHHVIEANTHSKAVLRVAAEELVKNNKDMYYLPSYELVMECSQNPWEADHRHVTQETVQRVIDMFKEMFVIDNIK